MKIGSDPPAYVIQGIESYQSGLDAGRADMYDRQAERAKKKKV